MKVSVWKQMVVSALLIVCYPLIWLYFKAKDERALSHALSDGDSDGGHCRQLGMGGH